MTIKRTSPSTGFTPQPRPSKNRKGQPILLPSNSPHQGATWQQRHPGPSYHTSNSSLQAGSTSNSSHSYSPRVNNNFPPKAPHQRDAHRGAGRDQGRNTHSYAQPLAQRKTFQQANHVRRADHPGPSTNSSPSKSCPSTLSLSEPPIHPGSPTSNAAHELNPGSYEQIEHLHSPHLECGTKLAGIIIQITQPSLIVALPCHRVAHVPISQISSFYTKRLEETAEEDELKPQSSSDHSHQSRSSMKDLNQIFCVGQWIRCSVLTVSPHHFPKGSARAPLLRDPMKVTLTLDPAHVNSGIDKSNLRIGMTLTGAVQSIKDKGYTIDLGIPLNSNLTSQTSSINMTAFVGFANATQSTGLNHMHHPSSRWEIGQLVSCKINKLSENGATCVVSLNTQDTSRSALTVAPSINSILPLHMVPCQVSAIIPSRGLNVNILGSFKGFIDLSHLGLDGTKELAPEEKFHIGQKLSARVLWDTTQPKNHTSLDEHEPIPESKIFILTLLDHIVKQDPSGLPSELHQKHLPDSWNRIDQIVRYPVGYTFQTVRIHRVEEGWGVCVTCIDEVDGHPIEEMMGKRPIGFAHISAITDSSALSLSQTSGPFKIGSAHKARVTGISPVDGCLQISLQPSVINRALPEDIPTGALLDVTVKRVTSSLLIVQIHNGVDGIVWPDHYSDVTLRQPGKRFFPGAKLKARVLYTNSEKNQVILTLRKSLICLDAEIITSYHSARTNLVTFGVVKTVAESSMKIEFFGKTQGEVPISQANENPVGSMRDLYSPGQSVKVKIIGFDVQRRYILASCKLGTANEVENNTQTTFDIGDQVSAFVTGVGVDHVELNLCKVGVEPSTNHPVQGLICKKLLASKLGLSHLDSENNPKPGDEIKDLVVTGKDEMNNLVIVGLNPPCASHPKPTTTSKPMIVGEQIMETIRSMQEDRVVFDMRRDDRELATEAPVEGSLPIASPPQKRQVFIDELRTQSLVNQQISELQLTDISEERDLRIVDFANLQSNEPALAHHLVHPNRPILPSADCISGKTEGLEPQRLVLNRNKLHEGQIFKVNVVASGTWGIRLQIPEIQLSGLCHPSRVYDDAEDFLKKFAEDLKKGRFKEGMKLRAALHSIDAGGEKIGFSIKPSVVDAKPDVGLTDPQDLFDVEVSESSADQSTQSDSDQGTTDTPSDLQPGDQSPTLSADFNEPPLPLSTGLLRGSNQSKQPDEAAVVDKASTSGIYYSRRRVSPPRVSRSPVEEISVDVLEKCVLESPNSSELWIELVDLYVRRADITKARKTAKRALEVIHYREQGEKWNVWVCLLNLENTYGTEEQFSATFSEASGRNDCKAVWLKAAEIYYESGKLEKAEKTYRKAIDKFPQSCKVWCMYGAFLLQTHYPNLEDLLSRSLQILPKRKHIKTMMKFSQLEFILGDPDIGRRRLEELVGAHPLRIDIWTVYLDLEIEWETSVDRVRSLFSRLMEIRLNPSPTKSILKKWYNYEKIHGDEQSQEMVVCKAKSYVASLMPTPLKPDSQSSSSED